ncbi:MAG: DUF3667 domain-containing protein [Acidobacteriota bacterium]
MAEDEQAPETTACRNCAEPTTGPFCAACGQSTKDKRAPFVSMIAELAQSFIAFDSVVLRSLPRLLFQPGRLTREYLDGKRASQVAPLRLYLFLSVLFFLFVSIPRPDASNLVIMVDDVVIGDPGREGVSTWRVQLGDVDMGEGNWFSNWLAGKLQEQRERLQAMGPQELVNNVVAALNSAIPKALILFVPLLALVLRVLYVLTPWIYFDHLIFALHAQSALFLSLLVLTPLFRTPLLVPTLLTLGVAAPVYGYLAMRRVYGGGRAWLLFRFVAFAACWVVLLLVIATGVAVYVTFAA